MTTKDMTSGSPTKLILLFTLPLLIGNIFQQFYSLVDTLIVGRTIGVDALAAVGSTGAINFLILGFIQGITAGFCVVTAQCFGSGNKEKVRQSAAACIILCILFALMLTLISVFGAMPLLKLLNTPDNIIYDAYNYIVVIFWGTAATIFYNMISNILRALGDSKTPLIFLIVASFLNIFLDIILIVNFHMGVAGAAWATVVSQLVSGLLCLLYTAYKFPILHLKKSDFKLSRNFLYEHLRIGFPMGFQLSVLTIGIIFVQAVLNSFGSTTIAAYTAASKVDQVAAQAIISLGITSSTYAAQNFGAGNLHRIRVGIKKTVLISLIFCVTGGLIVAVFGKALVGLFITGYEPQVIEQAQIYLNIIVPFYFALGLLVIFRSALQGMGNSIIPFWSGIIELIMRVSAAFILGKWFGYAGVCFASPAAWIGAAVLLYLGYIKCIKQFTWNLRSGINIFQTKVMLKNEVNNKKNFRPA